MQVQDRFFYPMTRSEENDLKEELIKTVTFILS